jgi:hypothetical protein
VNRWASHGGTLLGCSEINGLTGFDFLNWQRV